MHQKSQENLFLAFGALATLTYFLYELFLGHVLEFALGLLLFTSVIIDIYFFRNRTRLPRFLLIPLVVNKIMFFLCLIIFTFHTFYIEDRFDFYFLLIFFFAYSIQAYRQFTLIKSQYEELDNYVTSIQESYDHIIITDTKGRILFCNRGAELITGYLREEMLGKNPSLWGGVMDQKYYARLWDTLFVKKTRYIGELQNRRKDGTLYDAEIRITPIFSTSGEVKFFVGTERDITYQKQVDRMKTEFISLASHQLRTPLTAVKWYLELLETGHAGKLTAEQEQLLDKVISANERNIELVNTLLDISRIEAGKFKVEAVSTDANSLAKEVIEEAKIKYMEKKQTVNFISRTKLPPINTDPKLLRNILMNLLTNAMKYSPNEGLIEIMLDRNGDDLDIRVKDNGMGIPKNQYSRVFTKFFRADNAVAKNTEGTGLGLYLVNELVKLLHGKICFTSEENKGTVFHVTIPDARSLTNSRFSN